MKDIITIGSTTIDFFWDVNFNLSKNSHSEKILEIPFGGKFRVENAYTTIGGNAANASVTFSRNGMSTSLFTKIGNDVEGDAVKDYLDKEKIDYSDVEISEEKGTARSMLLLQNGERTIMTYHGAIDEFSLENVNLDKLKAKWWYVSLPGKSYKLFDRLLDYAYKENIKIALNPSGGHLIGDGKEYLLSHLKKISFLVLNEEEAKNILDNKFENKEDLFFELDKITPGIVAMTSGSEGVMVSDGNNTYSAGIFRENSLKDRTGAGDAFGSGFVTGLIHKGEECKDGLCNTDNIKYAIRFASANATSVVEHIGSTKGILNNKDFKNNERWKNFKIDIHN